MKVSSSPSNRKEVVRVKWSSLEGFRITCPMWMPTSTCPTVAVECSKAHTEPMPNGLWISKTAGTSVSAVSIRVVPLGLEPRTPWLWVRCSNQLSYRTGLWDDASKAAAKIQKHLGTANHLLHFFLTKWHVRRISLVCHIPRLQTKCQHRSVLSGKLPPNTAEPSIFTFFKH